MLEPFLESGVAGARPNIMHRIKVVLYNPKSTTRMLYKVYPTRKHRKVEFRCGNRTIKNRSDNSIP